MLGSFALAWGVVLCARGPSVEPARPVLPRLDLPARQAVGLELFIFYPWTEPLAEHFGPLLEGKAFSSRRTYNRQKRKHLVAVDVRRIEGVEEPGLVVRMNYDASDRVQSLTVPREDQREEAVLSRLLAAPENPPIGCTMAFVFEDVDPDSLWFPLPSRIGGTSDAVDAFEIRGVRGVKLADAGQGIHEWEYHFTLDRPTAEEVFVNLHFDLPFPFTLDTPTQALARGAEIAQRLTGSARSKRGATR
jgi:hypothetical protein